MKIPYKSRLAGTFGIDELIKLNKGKAAGVKPAFFI